MDNNIGQDEDFYEFFQSLNGQSTFQRLRFNDINANSSEIQLTDYSTELPCSSILDNTPATIAGSSQTPVDETYPFKCAVCGDQAKGFHYDAISCSGCKTFFRRTVVAGKRFSCRKGGKCALDKRLRCVCRACRFRRCVEVGMNPRVIQRLLTEHRIRNDELATGKNCSLVKKRTPELRILQISSILPERAELFSPSDSDKWARTLEKLMRIENCCHYLRMSNYPITLKEELNELISRPCALSQIAKYQKITEFGNRFPPLPVMYRWLELDLCIATEYAKALDIFKQLSTSDQLHLLRSTAAIITVLMEVYKSYEAKCDTIIFPDGTKPLTQDFLLSNMVAVSKVRSAIETVRRRNLNREQYVLLKAIIFFTATLEKLSDEGMELVNRERNKLCSVLLDYLLREFGPAKGPAVFGDILSLTHTFLRFSETRRNYMILYELFGNIQLSSFVHQLVTRRK